MTTSKVFISYSHDSEEHKAWVADLARFLISNGIDVVIDAWNLRRGEDIPKFMEDGLSSADRVLMICTERYVENVPTDPKRQQTLLNAFEYCRDALTATDAHRHERIAAGNSAQFIDGFRGENGARGANGVGQRNALPVTRGGFRAGNRHRLDVRGARFDASHVCNHVRQVVDRTAAKQRQCSQGEHHHHVGASQIRPG